MNKFWLMALLLIPNLVLADPTYEFGDSTTLAITSPTSKDSISIPANDQEVFEASGGESKYIWKTSIGVFYETGNSTTTSIKGNSIIYKAPPCPDGCKDVVTVTDEYGHSDTIKIDVVANTEIPCSITPETYEISTGGNVTLELNGNNDTVSWVAHDGGELYAQKGKQTIFTAKAVGTYRITGTNIMDKTCSAMATITVDSNCHITPEQATISADSIQQFSMVGTNCNDISWYTDGGYIDQDGMYTAPSINGNYTVTAQVNNAGYSDIADIKVKAECLVTTKNIFLQPNASKFIEIASGDGPYSATSNYGDNIKELSNLGKFKYKAAQRTGEDTITVCCDGGLQCKEINANISQMYANLPKEVQINSRHSFDIIGGKPDYFSDSSNIRFTKGSGKGIYIAPDHETIDSITIYDHDSENLISHSIEVRSDISPIINPSIVHAVALGENLNFLVIGGRGPFTWNYTGSEISPNGKTANIVTKGTTGKYYLSVIDDATGLKSEKVTIPVTLSLRISPKSYTIYKGESDITKVRFDMSGGAGGCNWESDDIQILPENERDYHVIVRPQIKDRPAGTEYTVTCRDQAGKEASAIITVAKLTFDSDDDGSINSEEVQKAIGYYFEEHIEVNYKMDRTELFLHLENFRQ